MKNDKATQCRYRVVLLDYKKGFPYTKYLVGRFACKGDAIAYAIWRAHNVPAGRLDVFEVEVPNSVRALYRAG